MIPDRAWSTIPARPLRPFGSALDAATDKRLETPALITERVRKLRGTPACQACGNRGPWQCACEIDE